MKRISLWLILLALTPGIAEARRYISSSYRARYSPYALRYGSSGFVPGRLNYSLHALDYDSSGLVQWDTRYTPYATSYGNSGLFAEYRSPYAVPYSYLHPAYVHALIHARLIRAVHPHLACPPERQDCPSTRASVRAPSRSMPVRAAAKRGPDGLTVIRRHLQAKGLKAVGISRILRIDDMLVSADVIAGNRDVLIKYWNRKAIEQMDAKETSKQEVYEKYRRDWEVSAAQYRRNGGTVYSIMATDAPTIVALLDCCTSLNVEPGKPTETAMYAKN